MGIKIQSYNLRVNFISQGKKACRLLANRIITVFNRMMDVIKQIYDSLTRYPRGWVISIAAAQGDLAIVRSLLANGSISDFRRATAMINAARNGHLVIVQDLLASGFISEQNRALAIQEANRNGHRNIVVHLGGVRNVGSIDVHSGDRDQRGKNAIIHFYAHQGAITNAQIDEAYMEFCIHLLTHETDKEKSIKEKALKALAGEKKGGEPFGPFINPGSPFTLKGHSVDPQEFIGRLWIFANNLEDKKDRPLAILGMVNALADSVEDNGQRVCNGGKIHRLIVFVLQGRLAGVQIEDHDIGVEQISMEDAAKIFYLKPGRQAIKKLSDVLKEAAKFCEENPSVNKKGFLNYLADEENMLFDKDDRDVDNTKELIDLFCLT